MNAEELAKTLERHRRWLEQIEATEEGRSTADDDLRADLSDADLRGLDLAGADLRGARLVGADLRKLSFKNTRLDDADLSEADLTEASFEGAVLTNTKLAHAQLEHADLSGAKKLTESQLHGSDLFHAQLPENIDLQSIETAKQASQNLRPQLVSYLMICLYSWLTVSSTTDLDLVTNAKSVSFPFVEISLPIVGLYFIAPLLVVVFYLSCYLHIAIFWERLAPLPAILPDGSELTMKIDASLLESLLEGQVPLLARRHPPTLLSRFNIAVIHLGLEGLVISTLLFYWIRYLPRHDWMGTALHLFLLTIAILAAFVFEVVLRSKLGTTRPGVLLARRRGWLIASMLVVLALVVLSAGVFRGERLPWLEPGYAKLVNTDISIRIGAGEEEERIHGGELADMNLRFANFEGAFAVDTELDRSDLEGANLRRADLRGATLRGARLVEATLLQTQLQGALLQGALLEDSDLEDANLQDANLARAELAGASLIGAQLDRANASRATFSKAKLNGARGEAVDFSMAKLDSALLSLAKLPQANFFLADLSNAHLWKTDLSEASLILTDGNGANFSSAGLHGADLAQAKFNGAIFEQADLSGARLVFTRLNGAKLSQAQLRGADLSNSQLEGADLRGAELEGANFEGAWLLGTRLEGVDLSRALGLSKDQLLQACVDATTRLPPALVSDGHAILAEGARMRSEACP